MTLTEARNTLGCKFPSHEVSFPDGGFKIDTYQTPTTFQQLMTSSSFPPHYRLSQPGHERIDLQMIGMPGKEVVHGIAHRKMYDTASRPPKDALDAALLKKYGAPSNTSDLYAFGKRHTWFFDVSGNLISNSQYQRMGCMSPIPAKSGVTSGFAKEGCGVVLDAFFRPARDNPQLVEELNVIVVDPHGLASGITAVQQHFDSIENARRNAETNQASSDIDL